MSADKKIEKKFKRKYGIDLLPYAHEGFDLGEIVEYDGFLRRTLDFENVSIIKFLRLQKDVEDGLIHQLQSVKFQKSEFANIELDSSFGINIEGEVPNFASKIGLGLGFQSFMKISISEVRSKVLEDNLKFNVRQLVKDFKRKDKNYFKEDLKGKYYLDALYYAKNVAIELKNSSKESIEATLTKLKIADAKISVDSKNHCTVSFDGEFEVPFAARIKSLRDLMD